MTLKSTKLVNLVQDTKANLEATSKVLPSGIVFHEIDTNKIKISNGTDTYTSLPYSGGEELGDHSSVEPKFGIGTTEKYGHVKVALPEGGIKISDVKEINLKNIYTTEKEDGDYIDAWSDPVISSIAKSDITGNIVIIIRELFFDDDYNSFIKNTIIMKNNADEILDTYELVVPDTGYYDRFKVKYLNNKFMYYYVRDHATSWVSPDEDSLYRLYYSSGDADQLDMTLIDIPWKQAVHLQDNSTTLFELKDITYNPNTNDYLLLGFINSDIESDYHVYILHLPSDFTGITDEEGVFVEDDGTSITQSYTFKVLSDGTISIVVLPQYSAGE